MTPMIIRMMREIRFSLGPESPESRPTANSWAGKPFTNTIAPHLRLQAVVTGPVDAQTGYLCSITKIDRLLRDHAIEPIRAHLNHPADTALIESWPRVADRTPPPAELESLTLWTTPQLRFTINRNHPTMISLTYAFEFSAAHRLYCDNLSDEDNRRIFGKCANPNGHGHNYVVEVTVGGSPDPRSGSIIPLHQFESIVNEQVIDRFDHKHLNLDCSEFAELNPSVENITRVIFDRLSNQFDPATLQKVRVYETPKTYAEFTGD
jgi:6-pyruvoyltetrahydropterin/6-carboxytetrahydropterin synthase